GARGALGGKARRAAGLEDAEGLPRERARDPVGVGGGAQPRLVEGRERGEQVVEAGDPTGLAPGARGPAQPERRAGGGREVVRDDVADVGVELLPGGDDVGHGRLRRGRYPVPRGAADPPAVRGTTARTDRGRG